MLWGLACNLGSSSVWDMDNFAQKTNTNNTRIISKSTASPTTNTSQVIAAVFATKQWRSPSIPWGLPTRT